MADLITHSLSGYILKKKAFPSKGTSFFIAGCCLPDFVVHIPANLIRMAYSQFSLTHPYFLLASLGFLHEPLGYGLLCFWLAQFFPQKKRIVFLNLLGGGLFHYFLDIFQHHIRAGYRPLYPFYDRYYEIGWISPEGSLYTIPLWIVLSLWIYHREKKKVDTGPEKN